MSLAFCFRIIVQKSITVGNSEAFLVNSPRELGKFLVVKGASFRRSVD